LLIIIRVFAPPGLNAFKQRGTIGSKGAARRMPQVFQEFAVSSFVEYGFIPFVKTQENRKSSEFTPLLSSYA
jgi:hypothetical protein